MFLIFQSGEFEILKLDKMVQFYSRRVNQDSNDHEQKILSIDTCDARKMVVTAGADNKIKLWSSQKILLCQINLQE